MIVSSSLVFEKSAYTLRKIDPRPKVSKLLGVGCGMSIEIRQQLEQKIELAAKMELRQYLDREELYTHLYTKAAEEGKVRRYQKHGMDFEYALVSAKDLPVEVVRECGHAFCHFLYDKFDAVFLGEKKALSKGSSLLFVIEDAYPEGLPQEFIKYAAVHEYGESITLGNHLFAVRLEWSIAEREGNLERYNTWIANNCPTYFPRLFQLDPSIIFPNDEKYLDEIIELTTNHPGLNIIRSCPWPQLLLNIINRRLPVSYLPTTVPFDGRTAWPHQATSLISLEALRRTGHKSAYLEIGTGGGKTFIAVQDALNYQATHLGTKILWLAHRQELLDQAAQTFKELRPTINIARKIRAFNPETTDVLIVSKQALEMSPLDEDVFSYIVVDEAHHAYADGYQSVLEQYRADFKLGITATPRRFSDRKHIRDLFGEAAFKMNLLDLVKADIICPIRFRKIETNIEVAAKLHQSGEFKLSHFWQSIKETARNQVVLDTYLGLDDDKKGKLAITFCVNVEHAKSMAEQYRAAGIRAEAIHGILSFKARDAILERFRKGETQMLTAVDILSEGVDFPPVEVVLMARPTRSKTVWLQQIGRGVRKSIATGKRDLLVIDFVDNISNQIKQITFEEVFIPVAPKTGREKEKGEIEKREDVYIENMIDMDVSEIFGVKPLQPGELTTFMLARKINRSTVNILRAIKDGRIKEYVKRSIIIKGWSASIFEEKDIDQIKAVLNADQLPLQPDELTTVGLAAALGVSKRKIHDALKKGTISKYVKRTITKSKKSKASIFNKADLDSIKKELKIVDLDETPLQPGEITASQLAEKIEVFNADIHRGVKQGKLSPFLKRITKHRGKKTYIFDEKDIDKIKKQLKVDELQLQDTEITITLLAVELAVSVTTIYEAINDDRISAFVKRKIKYQGGDNVLVFNRADIETIRTIVCAFVIKPGEINITDLADRIKVDSATIARAIRDERIRSFVKRKIKYKNKKTEITIFNEKDIIAIRDILVKDRLNLQVGEMTAQDLAGKIGVSDNLIRTAVRDGRISQYVRRTVEYKKVGKASIFNESDLEAIKNALKK